MKIKKIILKNFRGYQDTTVDFDLDFNTIIGKNDVGKSTILEALDVFLEGGAIKIDVSDCSVFADNKEITIGIVFEIEKNKEYLLDSSIKTTPEKEFLLNKDGLLEIHKKWDCSNKTITAKSLSICFNAYYFNEFEEEPLITKKNPDLKNELKKRKLNCSDEKVNSLIRHAIYDSLTNTEKKEQLIQIDKEDSKKTWEAIKQELPMLFLFQSDRANKDSDKDVQDPLKAITKQAVTGVENELNKITASVKEKIEEMAKLTVDKIREMDSELANSLKPNITTKAWDSLFSFTFDGDNDIPINKRGSGMRRLILFNYFKVIAERENTEGRNAIYAIEEPETSQHPNHQIMLVKSLQELSKQEKSQVFITTHSPEIAKFCGTDSLIFLKKDNNTTVVDISKNKIQNIVDTLGVMPYISTFCVFVEGKRDIDFLKNINENIKELKDIVDLKEIKILPLIGGNLENWVNREYIKNSNIKAFYLLDNDKDSNKKTCEEINTYKNKSKAFLTNSLMMENYCHYDLIKSKFNIIFTEQEKTDWNKTNIVTLIKSKTSNLQSQDNDIKNKINKDLSKQITKQYLEELNVWSEVKSWFKEISEMSINK